MSDLGKDMIGYGLDKLGAVEKGHFILASGRHSDTYFEKFRVLGTPWMLRMMCEQIAWEYADGVDVVVGPATGGMIVAYEVARLMQRRAVYVERVNGEHSTFRGEPIAPGERVLVVDDVLTTGGTLREIIKLLQPVVVGVAVLVDRSESPPDLLGIPVFSSIRMDGTSYAEGEVPESLATVPVTSPGRWVSP